MGGCCDGVCGKCHGGMMLVFGVVLFVATWYAKAQNNVYLVWYTLAVLAVLKGLMKLSMPDDCGHCQVEAPARKKR